jgi:4-hydroxyphenylpyruvate dioxygenase
MIIDHVHFHVHDARALRQRLVASMGWIHLGSETLEDRQLEILRYRTTPFLLSSPRGSDGSVAEFLERYAPGVADVAFRIEDLGPLLAKQDRWRRSSGPGRLLEPGEDSLACLRRLAGGAAHGGPGRRLCVQGWGSVRHTLLEARQGPHRSAIDHVVLNVPRGELHKAADFYRSLLDLRSSQSFRISTDHSGLHSQVLRDSDQAFYLNINEPASCESQIQAFLQEHHAAGVQHIALHADPLLPTVAGLRDRGASLLPISAAYYESLRCRLDASAGLVLAEAEWQEVVRQRILIDWQSGRTDSLLLQIFSMPLFAGASFFFEFIERRGAVEGFGEGNFLALYEAMESHLRGGPAVP